MSKLTFDEYQKQALSTAIYPDRGNNLYYPCLGLGGECGEVLEKVKKIMRDKGGVVSEEDREAIKKELGDVSWYLASLAYELNLTMEEVAQANLDKLAQRKEKGTIQGSGDNR